MDSLNIQRLSDADAGTQEKFITRVYAWMGIALAITAITAYATVQSRTLLGLIFASKFTFYGLIIGELALVWYLSAQIRKLSVTVASVLFIVYSVINGLTLSSIFLVYTMTSIAHVFGISALMFGAMSIFGMKTKSNLNSMGRYLFMALIGVIIASVVNIFLKSSMMSWMLSIVTVIIFTGLTAYDTQKIMKLSVRAEQNETYQKVAIIGALHLYLDFINIFMALLRLFGRRN